MPMMKREKEWPAKMRRFIRVEPKRAGVTYAELARRLNEHGLESKTEASVNSKSLQGTCLATFRMPVLAVAEISTLTLADL